MDNDIMIVSKNAGAPVPFTVTAKDADGNVVASGAFSFDATAEKMYLTVTADGRIVEDKDYEGYAAPADPAGGAISGRYIRHGISGLPSPGFPLSGATQREKEMK